MLSRSAESVKGNVVQLADAEGTETDQPIWTIADESEAMSGVRFNFHLHALKSDLETYGVGINRYWVNRGERQFPNRNRLLLVDDLVHISADLPRKRESHDPYGGDRTVLDYTKPVYFHETQHQDDCGVGVDARMYQFGRCIVGLSIETILSVATMIEERVDPGAVHDTIEELLSES